jgi:hypothetical protein
MIVYPPLSQANGGGAARKSQEDNNSDLSTYMTVVVVFVTHGLINSLLLAFSPLRCAYWNNHSSSNTHHRRDDDCTVDEAWMLNWLAFGHFHVHLLVACVARGARGHVLLEQRVVGLVTAMILSNLSTGVFVLDQLNKPMAAVQVLVYLSLLVVLVYHTATAPFVVPLPAQVRSSSFDHRRQMPVASVAVAFQFISSSFQVYDMTFGNARDTYLGDMSSRVFQSQSHAATTQMLWVALILGGSVLLTTVPQQKMILAGETLAMFLVLFLMTGDQGSRVEPAYARAGCLGSFFSLLIALFGSL